MDNTKITYNCLYCGKPNPKTRGKYRNKFCCRKCCCNSRVRSLSERFWEKVSKTESCWLWTGATARGGYGLTSADKKRIRAHRASFEMAYGKIPEGLLVCHKCDNPPCVRPDHLFLGTQQDNVADRHEKGRTSRACEKQKQSVPKGEKCHLSKLTEKDVLDIRVRCQPGQRNMAQVAREYGLSSVNVQCIVHRKTWKHI